MLSQGAAAPRGEAPRPSLHHVYRAVRTYSDAVVEEMLARAPRYTQGELALLGQQPKDAQRTFEQRMRAEADAIAGKRGAQ